MSKENDAILFYEGEYYMFSNFAAFAVKYNGRVWMTSEHAYQAAKFEDEQIVDSIHTALSAHDSKKLHIPITAKRFLIGITKKFLLWKISYELKLPNILTFERNFLLREIER